MIDYGTVRSTIEPDNISIDDYSVWVNTNIHSIQVTIEEETHTEYEYNQKRYTKDEYILMMNESVDKNQSVIDYNIMMEKLDDPEEEQ